MHSINRMHTDSVMCLAFSPIPGIQLEGRELHVQRTYLSSRNHRPVTLSFSKVKPEYIRALPKTPNVSESVAGRIPWPVKTGFYSKGVGKPLKGNGSKTTRTITLQVFLPQHLISSEILLATQRGVKTKTRSPFPQWTSSCPGVQGTARESEMSLIRTPATGLLQSYQSPPFLLLLPFFRKVRLRPA